MEAATETSSGGRCHKAGTENSNTNLQFLFYSNMYLSDPEKLSVPHLSDLKKRSISQRQDKVFLINSSIKGSVFFPHTYFKV